MDQTFIKGLRVLELLCFSPEPRGVTSLANECGLTKSNVHRVLTTLVATGYAKRKEENGTYELTSKIWELGLNVQSRFDLAKVAARTMQQLADATNESIHLSILDELEVLYIDKIESQQPIKSYTRIGGRAPAWCVATGKSMLAAKNMDVSVIAKRFEKFTSTTITDKTRLHSEFATIRNKGFAVNRGEWRENVFGIASAITDASGEVIGAIGISGPGTRFKSKQIKAWAELVVVAARDISQQFGGGKPRPSAIKKDQKR